MGEEAREGGPGGEESLHRLHPVTALFGRGTGLGRIVGARYGGVAREYLREGEGGRGKKDWESERKKDKGAGVKRIGTHYY